MNDEVTFEETWGNVFAALGFDDPDLELVKALLSGKIAEEIGARGWTQQQAADVLGIDHLRISRLLAGKTGQFSLERLIGFLERLSFDVRIEMRPAPVARGRVTVTV